MISIHSIHPCMNRLTSRKRQAATYGGIDNSWASSELKPRSRIIVGKYTAYEDKQTLRPVYMATGREVSQSVSTVKSSDRFRKKITAKPISVIQECSEELVLIKRFTVCVATRSRAFDRQFPFGGRQPLLACFRPKNGKQVVGWSGIWREKNSLLSCLHIR